MEDIIGEYGERGGKVIGEDGIKGYVEYWDFKPERCDFYHKSVMEENKSCLRDWVEKQLFLVYATTKLNFIKCELHSLWTCSLW